MNTEMNNTSIEFITEDNIIETPIPQTEEVPTPRKRRGRPQTPPVITDDRLFKIGDKVKLKFSATKFSNGDTIPESIRYSTLYVTDNSSDEILGVSSSISGITEGYIRVAHLKR